MEKTVCGYLADEIRSGRPLSEEGKELLDVLAFLYGSEEDAKKVVLGEGK